MKKTHSSKKQAWYLSLISLVLCVSMLAGTTFAWFTDNVTSGINTIAAGVLDVELYHSNAAVTEEKVGSTTELFLDVNGEDILWEPGVVSWENLRVTNAGDLALNWKLSLNTANENFVIDPETGIYYGLSKALKVGIVPGGITATDRAAVVASVAETDWTTLSAFLADGQLLPASEGTYEETFGIVIWWEPGDNDNWWNLNNDKQLTSGEVLSIDLGVALTASQMVYENDSFNNDYDEEASYTFGGSYSHNISVATDADGKVAVEATMGNADEVASALVPVGTKLEAGTTDMTLSVNSMEGSGANITAGAGESISSVDVHVTGLAADNTVPVKVTVKHLLPKYMNAGNYTLYHVENGTPVLMTLVTDPVAHNEYSYDPFTGDVTMTLANFCEISAAIKDERVWEGKIAQQFSGGTGTADDPFLIASADQLALMSKMVSGNRDAVAKFNYSATVTKTTPFAASHYKLVADIRFPGQEVTEAREDDSLTFYPVGYWYYKEGAVDQNGTPIYEYGADFTGVFDGQGHTISGIYQNTWQMNGYYNDGYPAGSNHWKAAMGIFGAVYDATIKNLTIADFESDGEFAPTGCVAAFAGGNSVFENISLENCNPRVYNTGNGGIVGLNYNDTEGSVDNLTFRNITVDQTNKISALWGSYDVSCGGILGRLRDNDKHGDGVYNTATFENCHVAAIMDVYNDVCANYQYYQYRYCGMYVGTVDYVDTIGVDAVKAKIVSADNCFYYIGDWNQYWYCELVENSLASYTHDHQFSRLEKITSVKDIQDAAGNWTRTGNFVIPADAETDATCFHIRKNAEGNFYEHEHEDEGTEVINGETILKEDRQHYHLPFNQLFTGYGWGSTAVRELNGISAENDIDSKVKFDALKSGNPVVLEAGKVYKVGELFGAKAGMDIQDESVQVLLSSMNNMFKCTYTPNTSNWAEGTVSFSGSGTGRLSINDYSYCKITSMTIAVEDKDHGAHCTCGGTGVGNACDSNVLHGWIAWDGKSDITAGGNYYLTQDITSATQHWIGLRGDETGSNQQTVINLCLNGHSITSSNRVFAIGEYSTVNIMNCKHATSPSVLTGSGTLSDTVNTTTGKKEMVQAGLILVQYGAKLGIYGGAADAQGRYGISMQYVDHASGIPTTGGIMDIAGETKVTMYGGAMYGGKASLTGGSVHIATGGTFELKGGLISGGSVVADGVRDNGGNIFVSANATFEMTGGTLIGGVAKTEGGNIYVGDGAKATITGGLISGGQAQGGGNIVVRDSGVLTMTGGTVENGLSIGAHGGNIYAHTGGTATITGGLVRDGIAKPIDEERGDLTDSQYNDKLDKNGGNLSLSGNTTIVTIGGNASFQGGQGDRGGNIFFHSGSLTIQGNAKIENGSAYNKSYGNGGDCIHYNKKLTSSQSTLKLSGSPIISDIRLDNVNEKMVAENLTGSAKIGISGGIQNYVFAAANNTGYSKYFKCNNPYFYIVEEGKNLKFAGHDGHCVCGGTYAECDHTNLEGGWKAWDGKSNIGASGNYYLTQDVTGSTQYWMGGSYQNSTPMTINLCLNGHSIDSLYRVFGVAPYVTFNLMNCSATESVLSGCCSTGDNGRVVHLHAASSVMSMYGNITLRGKEMSGRVVPNGGAVNCYGTFNMYGGTIYGASVGGAYELTNNGVKTQYYGQGCGGAIYVSGAFNLYDGTIYGGKGNVLWHTNATLNGNVTEIYASRGGVVYLTEGAKVNMYGGTVYGSEMGDGGTFWLGHTTSKLNIEGGTIYAGYATYGGGAVKMQGGATLNISNAIIDGSYDLGKSYNAGAAGGGALCIHGGKATIKDVTIQNCTAGSGKGGAMNIWGDSVSITLSGNMQIMNNKNSDGTICDIYLSNGKVLNLVELDVASSVGITMEAPGQFTASATEEQVANFFSNMEGYEVGYENGYLALREVTNPEDVVE